MDKFKIKEIKITSEYEGAVFDQSVLADLGGGKDLWIEDNNLLINSNDINNELISKYKF